MEYRLLSEENGTFSCSTKDGRRKLNDHITVRDIFPRFILIWLDSDLHEWNDHQAKLIEDLRSSILNVQKFDKINECIDFISKVTKENVLIIMDFNLGQHCISLFHDIPQLHSIYFYGKNLCNYESIEKQYSKLKGTFPNVNSICRAVQQTIRNSNNHLTEFSVFPPREEFLTRDLVTIDRSFMYTTLLKEIIFDMLDTDEGIEQMAGYCKDLSDIDNHNHIDRFYHEYREKSPVWWYTRETFLYNVLNLSLRTQDIDGMILLGPFIRHLHQDIQRLHVQQLNNRSSQPFTVYRGQGMSLDLLTQIKENSGGLLSFNNFLSTSSDRDVSLAFAESNAQNLIEVELIGVLFEMQIDPSIPSSPFASLDEVGYYQDSEQEILFSMHTVFRIDRISCLNSENERLWQINLSLVNPNGQKLKILTDQMRDEIEGATEIHRMGQLLFTLGEYERAKQVYSVLLSFPTEEDYFPHYYNRLGSIESIAGKYQEAIIFYKKAQTIYEQNPTENATNLISTFNNIATAYGDYGDYSKAMSFYVKALGILKNLHDKNHPLLTILYTNMGIMSKNVGDHVKALSFYKKVLNIEQLSLCDDHPSIATTYRRIGSAYLAMGNYELALSHCQKAVDIHEKTLPSYHIELAMSYISIGKVFEKMGEYSTALSFYTKRLQTYEKVLGIDHPDLASLYNALGSVHHELQDYFNALLFYEKALNIWQKILSSDHPNLVTLFNNIALVYYKKDEYSKAIEFFEKSFSIQRTSLSENHRSAADYYNNMGLVYNAMGDFARALSTYDNVLRICATEYPNDHLRLLVCRSNIASVQYQMGNYSDALVSYETALTIARDILPASHPTIRSLLDNIEGVKEKL